jgi:spore coat protein A, manganese oxidase
MDLAIYRNGAWWIQNSSNGAVSVRQFRLPSDIPVPAEYPDLTKFSYPDGKTNIAVFRPETGA